MIDWLENIDRAFVLFINGIHNDWLDAFMWFVSGKLTWIPLYLVLLFLGIRKLGWKVGILFLLSVVTAVGLTDFICSGIIKELVQRYRPSHNLLLTDQLHFYTFPDGSVYKGGMYGFVSSHAGNFFALAWMTGWILKPYFKYLLATMLCLAVIISMSRIYLGVHYLSDIIGGLLVGTLVSYLVYRFVFTPLSSKIEQ